MYLCNGCYKVMHLSNGSKGSNPNQVFLAIQVQRFLWEKVTDLGVDFKLFHFADLLHAQKCDITR